MFCLLQTFLSDFIGFQANEMAESKYTKQLWISKDYFY